MIGQKVVFLLADSLVGVVYMISCSGSCFTADTDEGRQPGV